MTTPERTAMQASFQAEEAEGWAMFARAPAVRFAGADADGRPVLRTLSAVVLEGRLCVHGADDGQKLGLVGRPVVASYDEIVAQVPSYWVHPELACPASTYYLSVQAEGTLARVDDRAHKARILTAIMERFQPEGGYLPITADAPRYAKVLDMLLVAELAPTRVSCKHKLGQHRTPAQIERILAGLWQRGAPGDLRAMRLVREAHPARPLPALLRGPDDSVLCVAPDHADAREVAAMLEGQYWTEGFTHARMTAAQRGSQAWVVTRDAAGRVLASGRAVSDGARFGYVMDMIVRPELRGRGHGKAIVKLLLAHPAMRGLVAIGLRTRDAQGLYRGFGFDTARPRGEEMVLLRAP
ncbi:MAG: GNAT family N-acetyltransferase [Polyangiales bacterium]